MALPSALRRYFECNKRRVRIYPNRADGVLLRAVRAVMAVIEGPFLSEQTIVAAVQTVVSLSHSSRPCRPWYALLVVQE